MLQATCSDVEQSEHQQREAPAAIVTWDGGQRPAQPNGDVELPEVATDELQAAVRPEALRDEFDGQSTLTTRRKLRISSASEGPPRIDG